MRHRDSPPPLTPGCCTHVGVEGATASVAEFCDAQSAVFCAVQPGSHVFCTGRSAVRQFKLATNTFDEC